MTVSYSHQKCTNVGFHGMHECLNEIAGDVHGAVSNLFGDI